jgi:hypothetical protein
MAMMQQMKIDIAAIEAAQGALGGFLILDTASNGNGFGAAMSSLLWERLRNGDEDVASPFRMENRMNRIHRMLS